MFGPRSVNPFIEKNAKKRHDAIRTFPLNSVSRDRHVRVIINFHFVLIKKLQNVIMRDALLFDIDGTLLYARGVGRAAFGAAFLAAYGRALSRCRQPVFCRRNRLKCRPHDGGLMRYHQHPCQRGAFSCVSPTTSTPLWPKTRHLSFPASPS